MQNQMIVNIAVYSLVDTIAIDTVFNDRETKWQANVHSYQLLRYCVVSIVGDAQEMQLPSNLQVLVLE